MSRELPTAALFMLLIGVATAWAQVKIEYKSVAEARTALATKPGASSATQDGWLVVTEPATQTLWSFTPQGHAAHPSVVKRSIVLRGNDIFVDMAVGCEAAKAACDRLVAQFEAMNRQMREDLAKRR